MLLEPWMSSSRREGGPIPHRGDISTIGFGRRLRRDGYPKSRAHPQEIRYGQSEARSPHAAELADHLYRSSAADGVRRAVHRPPDAEEQRRRPRQGSEGVQDPDHYHYGRDTELLRLQLSRTARRVPRQAAARAHLDEFLG